MGNLCNMKRKIISYKPYLKELAKQLRQNSTLSEALLWNELKNRQLLGLDFDRQKPLDNFILDFYCKELMLAIKVDGDSHDYKYTEDDARQVTLESLGIRFLRFDDAEIKHNLSNVTKEIEEWLKQNRKV